jgi:serine/threonine-protein kinase
VWSPNGTRIAFVSNRDGGIFNIYQKNAGGTGQEELLLKTSHDKRLNDWSPDGRYLLYEEDDPQTKSDLWMLPVTGDRKPSRLLGTEFNEGMAAFSPDGAWIAYTSDESGSRQVYVRKFPTSDIRRQVSNGRAAGNPRWGSNGELFFDVGGTMTAVSTMDGESRSEFRPGASKSLFTGLMNFPHNFDVADRAERFLVLLNAGTLTATGGAPPITVVVNWKSGLSLPR